MTSTRSGGSSISGMPGARPRAKPPSTSGIGYGTSSQRATTFRPATETNRTRMKVSRLSTWPPWSAPGAASARLRLRLQALGGAAEQEVAHLRLGGTAQQHAEHAARVDDQAV